MKNTNVGTDDTVDCEAPVIRFYLDELAIERHATVTMDIIDTFECDCWHVLDFKSENVVNRHVDASTIRKRSICTSSVAHVF